MVKTNIQTFTGEVEILSNLHVGPSGSSYLTANGAASNVLDITGNVGATFFVGDGGFLSNIATTLSDIVNQGNVSANVLQFNSTSDYAGVGLVTSSNVGIQNTAPSHTLSIGDKIRVDDNTVETSGQSVIQVDGRILATRFQGDGGLLSNIATTFESIVNQGNVASNVVKFSSDSAYAGAGVITDSNVGIQNTAPTHNLSVGSNLHVNDTGSNVLTVHGNVVASNLNLGVFSITPAYGLNDVCNTSNGTSNVVQFQNATTSLVATSNITVGGNVTAQQLISTSNTEVGDRLKFSGSNVFVDTLRVADVAANIVTYDRTTGELLDSSGTFMNKFAVVSEQPPSDLFANATTVANHGGYTLTTSNLATNSNTYNAFDGTANAWTGGTGMYIGGSNVLIETNLTQLSNLHPTQFGDWLAIEFPYKTTLRHMKLTPATVWQSFPYAANLYATNNDLTWTEIKYWDGLNPGSASNVQTITVNATEQFKKYALVTTKLVPNTNIASAVAIKDWQLFTESFSIDGGKVAMAQQPATGGETVMDQHGPHSRGEAKLKKYPEIAFEEGKFDSNNSTNTYTQAGYTVTASSHENQILRSRGLTGDQGYVMNTTGQDLFNADGSNGIKGMQQRAQGVQTPREITRSAPYNVAGQIPSGQSPKSSGALTPTGTRSYWADLGGDIFDEWGMWYIFNPVDQTASYIQFSAVNGTTGTVYIDPQIHHGKTFIVKHGWVASGIFKLDVECEDPTFSFSIGMFGNMGSDTPTENLDKQYAAPWGTLNYNFNRTSSGGAANTDPFYTHLIPKQRSFNDATATSGTNFTSKLTTTVTDNDFLAIWFDTLQVGATMYFVKGASGNITTSAMFDWVANDITGEQSAWHVFDEITPESSWSSKSGTYYDGTSPANSYTGTTHQLGTGTAYGEWLKVKLSHRIKVTKFILYADDINEAPKSYKIYGSVTGSSWTELKDVSNETPSIYGNSHEITDTEGYRYIAIVVTQVNSDQGNVRIGEIKLYGYENFEGGDTSVDTTFTSIMNTPQISGVEVYVDGSLGETFTNRVAGPTVSNTHTTYVSAEKYWELSGNVESNVTLEANTFLSGDAPHSLSMWFNSSNLVSNASNSCIFSLGTEERLDHVSAAFSNNYQTVQKLLPRDLEAGDRFGFAVAMNSDGTKFIVGAYQENAGDNSDAGAAYIFTYNSDTGNWDERKLVSPDIEAAAQFGISVGMNSDGTKVIVGAFEEHAGGISDAGAAYIFTYSGGSWDFGTKIVAPDKEASDKFGYSAAMSGDGTKVIVGAYIEDHDVAGGTSLSSAGSAYIFTYDGSSWGTGAKIVASDRTASDLFGRSVAMNSDGTKVIVGADTGQAAYIFTYNGSSWVQQQILVASGGATAERFGYTVAMNSNGTKVIVGAYAEDVGGTNETGSAYIYTYDGSNWDTGTKIVAPDKEAGDRFGVGVAINSDGNRVTVAAYLEHANGVTDAGAAYIFAYDGSNWDTGLKISAPDKAASDHFSSDKQGVAMSGDGARVIVGALHDDDNGSSSGSVYVYDRDTTHHLTTDLKLQSNTWHNLTYAYQGEGGSKVTYLDGRKVAEDRAEDTFGDYPPFAMTGYSQGGYVVSESSFAGSAGTAPAWKAFDDLPVVTGSDITATYWQSITDTYETSGSYNWISGPGATGVQFTDTNGGQHSGEWIKLEMPHKLKLSYISYLSTYTNYMPKNFVILGSNDDNTWTLLKSVTGGTAVEDVYHDLAINADRSYKYYVWLTSAITGTGGEVLFANIKYYGHRENDLVRLPDPTNVLKYPHIAMTGYTQRGYVASTDNENPELPVWKVFDNKYWITGAADIERWQPLTQVYGTAGADVTAGGTTTLADSSTKRGNYIQLESPHKLNVTKYKIYSAAVNANTFTPKKVILLGSNTGGTDWVSIDPAGEVSPTYSGSGADYHATVSFSNTSTYKYHRLVVRATVGGGLPLIFQWQLFGTEEATPVPIQIGGGNIDKVANFRVYDKFIGEDQALEIWDAQKDEFGRAKSSMTLQKGRLGIGTDEPQGRLAVLDEPHNLEEFPPRGIPSVGPINAGNSKVYIDGHGTYEVLYSVDKPSHINNATDNPLVLFDKTFNNLYSEINTFALNSAGATGSAVGSGNPLADPAIYTGNASGRRSLGGYEGIWYGLKFPFKVNLSQAHIQSPANPEVTPNTAVFLGSEDGGLTWSKIGEFSGASWVAYNYNKYTLSHTKPINAAAIVITHSNHYYAANMAELKFFGTREQGQSVLHDGQLTLTKNLTVPRIGPALDADDTPRRDRLVVEYNTSTNPTFEGAVRDTSGRGFDAVMRFGAKYDVTGKAFEFPLNPETSSNSGNRDSIETGPILDGTQLVKGYSVSTWFRANSQAAWEQIWVLGKNGLGLHEGLWLSGSTTISIHTDAGGGQNYYYPCTSGGGWKHVTFVRKGTTSSNHDVYVDGVKVAASSTANGSAVQAFEKDSNLILGENIDHTDYGFDGAISNFKLYDTVLTAEEVKTLYDMGRCDEGHHLVNFSKTRVGIGLGDGEAPRGDLDVRGHVCIGPRVVPKSEWFSPALTIIQHSSAYGNARPGVGIQFGHIDDPGHGWMLGLDNDSPSGVGTGNEFVFEHLANGTRTGYGGQLSSGYVVSTFNNFTGQHRTFIKNVPFSQAGDLEGLVVSSDQNKYIKMSGGIEAGSNAITTNESLPIVSLSNVVTDKKCFGVISASENPEQRSDAHGIFKSLYPKEKGDTRVYINSVGEGAIWVSNIGGNLEAGDYITTSNVAGYGQKQESEFLANYTVAKITMDCDFNPATQPIQQILRSNVVETYYLGNVHKVKNVPHEFVTTTVTADDAWSNVSINPSDTTYAEWSNLEANTQNTYTLTYTQTSNVVYDTKYTLTTTSNVTESDPWDSVFIDPPSVTYAEYSNLEANTQSSYSLTFTKTTTDEKTPEEWSALESNTQSLYNMVYYQSVEEEVASDYPGATTHTRVTDVIENELDAHGQIQWEDHATETEKAYKIRYLDASGAQTDSANAVHIAAFVGCTYHCG